MNLMPTFTKDVWGKWDRIPRPPESPVRDSPPPTASRGAEGDGDPAQWLDGCDASGESGRQLSEYHQATPRVRGKSEECHADVLKSTPICRSSLSATAQSHGHASHISCWLDSTIIRSRNCQPPVHLASPWGGYSTDDARTKIVPIRRPAYILTLKLVGVRP